MRRTIALTTVTLVLAACTPDAAEPAPTPSTDAPTASSTTTEPPPDGTLFGFFPFPPGPEFEDVVGHFQDLASYGDVVLMQPEVPWGDFANGAPAEDTAAMENVRNVTSLAGGTGLEVIYIVDPLNGLDRAQFIGLPDGWPATFQDPMVRAAFTGFATWLAAEFQPRYLGLSSEINTYLKAHPDDTDAYLDLYRTTRAAIKSVSPDTAVFVTFQWEVVNGLADLERTPPQWEQIERFEPDLDVWAISSYPWVSFESGAAIPADYYAPLLDRTAKPLAVAEGGFLSRPTGPFPGDTQSQIDHLTAVHDQIGERLEFWINLVLDDFDIDSVADQMRAQGRPESDIDGLATFGAIGLREFDGTPKPAMTVWEQYRSER